MIESKISKAGHAISDLLVAMADNLPSPALVLGGSVLTGLVMAVAGSLDLYLQDWEFVHSHLAVALVFFCGGSLGFLPGYLASRSLFTGGSDLARSIWSIFAFGLAIHLGCAAAFALQYRIFYAHWHANFPSLVWFFQFSFTSAAAAYQFTVHAVTGYFPFVWLIFLGLGLTFRKRAH